MTVSVHITSVLVVEDIPDMRHWLRGLVTTIFVDAEVFDCDTLSTARSALDNRTFDLALIDLGLPDGSGVELIRDIKQCSPSTACVVTTIYDNSDFLYAALRAGAEGYLLKDEEEDAFSIRLQGILAGQPPLSPSIARRMLAFFQQAESAAPTLTERESEVLALIAKGYSVRHSAELLGLSRYTVADYVKALYRKLQVNSRAEATIKALDMGLIHTDTR